MLLNVVWSTRRILCWLLSRPSDIVGLQIELLCVQFSVLTLCYLTASRVSFFASLLWIGKLQNSHLSWNLKFSTVPFTTTHHCYWPWPRWTWFPSSNGVSLIYIYILIWFFHLRHFQVLPFRCGISDQNFACISNLIMFIACLAHPSVLYEAGGHKLVENGEFDSFYFSNTSIIWYMFLCPYARYQHSYIQRMRVVLKMHCAANLFTLTFLCLKNAFKCHVVKIYVFVSAGVDNLWICNWKGYGRKPMLPCLRCYPAICLEDLRCNTKNVWSG